MRIKKLQHLLKEKRLDLALIFSLDGAPNQNILYFSGYSGSGVLAVLTKKKPFLFVPEMEYEKARKTGIKVFKAEKKRRILDNLSSVLSNEGIKKIGIEEDKCSLHLYKKVREAVKARYTDISSECAKIRMIKESSELENIRKACSVTDSIFTKICRNFRFKTEKELRGFILSEIWRRGCEPSFQPIVASGEGSSQPHYDYSGKIKKGFLMLDFGVKYKGYCSDMTRMLYIGKPSKKELSDFALVLKTIHSLEKAAEKQKKFSDLYQLSIKLLGGKSKYFTHSLGHGLGIAIHELPNLNDEDNNIISENVPFTIEPGVYFPGKYGVRVEDTVVFKKGKLEILTKSDKELAIIS